MLQFSLRNLLIAVTAAAVGIAALLNANAWWVALLWGAALSTLVFAGLVALFRRESQRAFWGGYLLVGSLYLLLLMHSLPTSASAGYAPLNHDNLVTTKVIVGAYFLLPTSKTAQYLPAPPPPAGGIGGMPGMGGSAGSAGMMSGMPSGMGMGPPMIPNPSYLQFEAFTEVGHALWILFLSWLGGTVAFWLVRTREKSSTAVASVRPANGSSSVQ